MKKEECRMQKPGTHLARRVLYLFCFFILHSTFCLRASGQSYSIDWSKVAGAVLLGPNLASAKPGFVDRLIHGTSHADGHTLVTFEKTAKKLPATIVLPTS